MFPTFRLGPWEFQTYSTAYAAGLVLAGMLAFIRLHRLPEPPPRHMRDILAAIAGGFTGTYLAGIFPTLQHLLQTGELVWIPRASFIGTLAGGALAVSWCPTGIRSPWAGGSIAAACPGRSCWRSDGSAAWGSGAVGAGRPLPRWRCGCRMKPAVGPCVTPPRS